VGSEYEDMRGMANGRKYLEGAVKKESTPLQDNLHAHIVR